MSNTTVSGILERQNRKVIKEIKQEKLPLHTICEVSRIRFLDTSSIILQIRKAMGCSSGGILSNQNF